MAGALALALLGGWAARAAFAQPRYKVSAGQLQEALAQRFPLRHAIPGVVELRLQTPRLRFLPEQNRLASELEIEATGPALRRSHTGWVELDFELRYERADQTLRAHGIRVQSVRLPSLQPQAAALLEAYVRSAAQQSLFEVVLHRLRPQDLALAETMGLEPGDITVAQDGLVIEFVARQPR